MYKLLQLGRQIDQDWVVAQVERQRSAALTARSRSALEELLTRSEQAEQRRSVLQVLLEAVIGGTELCKMSKNPPSKAWGEKWGKEMGFLGKGAKIVE